MTLSNGKRVLLISKDRVFLEAWVEDIVSCCVAYADIEKTFCSARMFAQSSACPH